MWPFKPKAPSTPLVKKQYNWLLNANEEQAREKINALTHEEAITLHSYAHKRPGIEMVYIYLCMRCEETKPRNEVPFPTQPKE